MKEIEERERKEGGSRGKGKRREVNRKSWQRGEGNTQEDRSGKEEWRREEGDRRGWESVETYMF